MESAHFVSIKRTILQELELAQKSIKIAVAWFTNQELFDKILEKKEDVSIELIILNDLINNGTNGLDFQKLVDRGGTLRYSNNQNPIHHKFCIIDDTVLINGSYNWTYFAENKNLENILVIKNNNNIINQYIQEFDKLASTLSIIKVPEKKSYDTVDNNQNIDREYIAYDLYYKGKENSIAKDIETASRLLPDNKFLADEYKNITTVKIEKKTTTSLGIEAQIDGVSGRFSMLIEKGQTVPYEKSGSYFTLYDNQKSISILTFKGDHSMVKDNQKIGGFLIADLPPKPAGKAQVIVSFELNEAGLLTVNANSVDTGNQINATYEIENLVF